MSFHANYLKAQVRYYTKQIENHKQAALQMAKLGLNDCAEITFRTMNRCEEQLRKNQALLAIAPKDRMDFWVKNYQQ